MSLLFLKQFTLLTFFFLWPFHYSIYGSFTTYKTQTFLIKHLSSRKRVFISLMNKITLIQFIKLKIKPINVLWVFDAVCFISHVIQHCNVFSPCILKYVLSLDFNCLLGFGIAVFSPPSCLPDLHQALSFGRCFETNVFRGEVSLSITAVPNSTTKCSELEGTTKDHGVQFWSTANLQILEDPNAGMSWAAAQCVQPALHSSHGTKHAIKSKSLLAAWSPWGLTLAPAVAGRNLLGDLCTSQGLLHLSAGWTNTFLWTGSSLGTGCDTSCMFNFNFFTLSESLFWSIFLEKNKPQKIVISCLGWKDRLDLHQPYMYCLFFPQKTDKRCATKMKA